MHDNTESEDNRNNSLMDQLMQVLYAPIPFLPDYSLIAKARVQLIKRNALNKNRSTLNNERKLRGKIHMVNKSRFELCEHIVEFNDQTWLFGEMREQSVAEVTAKYKSGIYHASKIVIID